MYAKIYDLSQPLDQDCSFWPLYPPFEVKYINRKAEHGVNAQYIMTSNHMGTHLDAPRHFVTNGKTIDQLPLQWLCGTGVIVDISDMADELSLFRPEDLASRADIREGDILFIHTGWHRYSFHSPEGDEEKYIHRHPGPHHSICAWLLEKKIHLWGVDMISTDHPMNLPIGGSSARAVSITGHGSANGAGRSTARASSTSCSLRKPTSSRTTRSSRTTVSTSRTSAGRSATKHSTIGA
jgi:arylformamidase